MTALAESIAGKLAESPQMSSEVLREALEREGHGSQIAAIVDKLRRSGLATLAENDALRAAAAWEDAAHLRLRSGTLSIERQAVAAAFVHEVGEANLNRLRDIQEQDQRSLRPGDRDESEAPLIVHPLRGR